MNNRRMYNLKNDTTDIIFHLGKQHCRVHRALRKKHQFTQLELAVKWTTMPNKLAKLKEEH